MIKFLTTVISLSFAANVLWTEHLHTWGRGDSRKEAREQAYANIDEKVKKPKWQCEQGGATVEVAFLTPSCEYDPSVLSQPWSCYLYARLDCLG